MKIRRKRNEPVVVAAGSVRLDDQSQEHYRRQFGERYVFVQWQPQLPTRRERRIAARNARLRNDGRPLDLVSCGRRRR